MQVTWVTNLAVSCHYFPPGLQLGLPSQPLVGLLPKFRCLMNRGTMGVNSLPKTVIRQRRACDFWTQALLRMSPAWVRFLVYNTGLVQVNWSRPTDSVSTENARLENRKLFKILFKLVYLRFPPLQIRTWDFRTCIFHPCTFVLTYSVLAYSILRYFRFPYLRFQSPPPEHSNKRLVSCLSQFNNIP